MGFGTQRTATALRGTLKTVSKAGKILGGVGQVLNSVVYVINTLDQNKKMTTGDHVGFWVGTAVFAGAATIGGLIVGAITLGYGVIEVGSWLYNGKSIEQNIFDN